MPEWILQFYKYLHRKHPKLVSRPRNIGSDTLEMLCVQYLSYSYIKKYIWKNNVLFELQRILSTLT